MSNRGWVVTSLALGASVSACFSVSANGGDDADLSIDRLSVTPDTVGDGESFEVAWKVSHTTKTGYVTEIGLFLGSPAGLEDGGERDSRRLFNVATTAGAPNGAADSSKTCTRTGTLVRCGDANGARDITGVTDFTFRACSSYVLSADNECETQAVSLSFP